MPQVWTIKLFFCVLPHICASCMKPAFTFVTLQPKFSTSIFGTSWMTDLLPPGIVFFFLSSNLILGNFSIVPLEHGILSFTMLAGFGRYSNKELLAKFDDSEFCSQLSMSVVTELTGVEWSAAWLFSLTISKPLSKLSCSLLGSFQLKLGFDWSVGVSIFAFCVNFTRIE